MRLVEKQPPPNESWCVGCCPVGPPDCGHDDCQPCVGCRPGDDPEAEAASRSSLAHAIRNMA